MHREPKQAFPFPLVAAQSLTGARMPMLARRRSISASFIWMAWLPWQSRENAMEAVAGILVGVIEAYLEANLIIASDRERLVDLFEAFREPDRAKAHSRIVAIHAAAVADSESSPAARLSHRQCRCSRNAYRNSQRSSRRSFTWRRGLNAGRACLELKATRASPFPGPLPGCLPSGRLRLCLTAKPALARRRVDASLPSSWTRARDRCPSPWR
jgi:hypothetical protein